MGVRNIGTLSDTIKDVECISVNGLYENLLILCLCGSESEKRHFFFCFVVYGKYEVTCE